MRDPIDLDQVNRTMSRGNQAIAMSLDREAQPVLVQPLHVRLQDLGIPVVTDRDLVAVRPDLGDGHAVGIAAQLELDRPSDLVLYLRSSAVRGFEQPGELDLLLVVIGLDGRSNQGNPGVLM